MEDFANCWTGGGICGMIIPFCQMLRAIRQPHGSAPQLVRQGEHILPQQWAKRMEEFFYD